MLNFKKEISSLRSRCFGIGVTMESVCKEAGYSGPTLYNWNRKLPKTLEMFQNIEKLIEQKEAEKWGENSNTETK